MLHTAGNFCRLQVAGCRLQVETTCLFELKSNKPQYKGYPCKNKDRDLGGIPPRSRRESRRDRGEILAAGIFFSRRESRRDPGKIFPGKRNSRRPKSRRDPAANLAVILAGK